MISGKVSIVIPCYNAEKYVAETIDSVLNQSYENIEIIVVNDGSTDSTEAIVKQYPVQYIFQPNSGVSVARNRGFQESNGEFICFLDADDILFEKTIEQKVRALQNDPGSVLVHGIAIVTDEHLRPIGQELAGKDGFDLVNSLLQFELPIPCPSNALIRRSALEEKGLFDKKLSTSADFDLWVRLVKDNYIIKVDEASIYYRRHDNAMFNNLDLYVRDIFRIYWKYAPDNEFKKYNWNIFLLRAMLSLIKTVVRNILKLF
jgi:glycosyltransferase involved in cell wall biosynthesis